MVTILSNVNALSASRQLGVSKIGLNTAITRLTTGRRVNNASDDANSLSAGNSAMASSRRAAAGVYAEQAKYFEALNLDGANAQFTELAYKLAEMEGGGNSGTAEYTQALGQLTAAFNGLTSTAAPVGTAAAVVTTLTVTDSLTALTGIRISQSANAAAMSDALSQANTMGINAETSLGIADAYLGADIGAEMANLTKYQIMMQAGTSALSNANQSAQTVLGLFR